MYLIPWVRQLVLGWAYGQIQDSDGEEIPLFAGGSWEADVQGIDAVSNPWAEQPLEAHRTK